MADPTKKRYDKRLNTMLDDAGKAMLHQLAEAAKVSEATIVRHMISERFRMAFNQQAVCADGTNCLCPHMHMATKPSAESDTELVSRLEQHSAAAAQTADPDPVSP